MKLTKLYSDIEWFKTIIFNKNFNLVCWAQFWNNEWEATENWVWKTKLLQLIDYLLINKNSDFSKKISEEFPEKCFLLEIELDANLYITILRKLSWTWSIFIKEHNKKYMDFSNIVWDEKQRTYAKLWVDKAKEILNSYIKIEWWIFYRKILKYFLKQQNSYENVFKVNEGKDKDRKPRLYKMLWFNENLLIKKYLLENNIEIFKNQIKELWKLETSDENEDSKTNNIKKEKLLKELEELKKDLKDTPLSSYNFDVNLINNTVQDIDLEIETLNKELYKVRKEISLINQSLNDKSYNIDIKNFSSFFAELEWFIPEKWKELTERIKDVWEFQKMLTKERNKILSKKKEKLDKVYESLLEKRTELDNKKQKSLELLKENNSFKKYNLKNVRISEILEELESLEKYSSITNVIDFYKDKINQDKKEKESIIESIQKANIVSNYPKLFVEISNLFWEIFSSVYDKKYKPEIKISVNANNNLDFDISVIDKETGTLTDISQSDAVKKIFCYSFCLSLMINYKINEFSFFEFAYNDGLLDWVWRDVIKRCLAKTKEYCNKYNIQFIISAIESNIPDWSIDDNDIIVRLSRENKLFWKDF